MQDYDVIVAGAGIAGSTAAAMAGKMGSRVLLVDRNSESEPGKKTMWGWVCGDAVAKSHIEFVRKNLGDIFTGEDLGLPVDGVMALSPDLDYKLPFDGEGYSLERPLFGATLFNAALKNNVEFRGGFSIEAPIIEDGFVKGIAGKNSKGEEEKIRAKVVIDALGISSMLRRKLPDNIYVDREIDYEDIELTGRFIYKLEDYENDIRYYDQKYALIHLNQKMSPGGYGWVFPKKDGRVNVGLGVQHRSLEIRNSKMGEKDNLKSLIEKYVKWNKTLKKFSLDNSFKNGEGYWSVPVRRQMEAMTFPGYIGAGDSMASPNPLSAGGIGPALIGGILAGKKAAECKDHTKCGVSELWDYNVNYNKQYGSKMAGMEVFRTFLQSMNDLDIDYGMRSFITYQEAVEITTGKIPELSLTSKIGKVIKGMKNMKTFKNLVWTVDTMKQLNQICGDYPKTPEGFPKYKAQVQSIIHDAKERLPPSPL